MPDDPLIVPHPEEPPAASAPPASRLRRFASQSARVWFGPQGLRAGWRLLVFVALGMGCMFVTGRFLRLFPRSPQSFRSAMILGDFVLFGSGVVASGIMSRLERRPWSEYGLPLRKGGGGRFLEGCLWGVLSLSVLLLLLYLNGNLDYGIATLHGAAVLHNAVFWGIAFLLVGLAEEFIFRGYPQFALTAGMGFWPAALVTSALFGLVHIGNQGENWLGAVNAGLIGLFFCLSLRRTGSLWFAVGVHAAWDWAETFLYGVPNSGQTAPGHLLNPKFHGSRWLTGGSVGPEGSVLAVVTIALMLLALHFRFCGISTGHQASGTRPE